MKSSIHKLIRALPDELLFGSSFRKAQSIEKAYLASSDKADFINTYQQAQLEKILSIAAKAPAYKNIRDYKNFADIPFSNKNDMQTDIDRFVVEKKGADLCSTGGTTSGRPLKFYIDKSHS